MWYLNGWPISVERQYRVWLDPELGVWRVWVTHPKGCSLNNRLCPCQMTSICYSSSMAEALASKYLAMWDEFAADKELENLIS